MMESPKKITRFSPGEGGLRAAFASRWRPSSPKSSRSVTHLDSRHFRKDSCAEVGWVGCWANEEKARSTRNMDSVILQSVLRCVSPAGRIARTHFRPNLWPEIARIGQVRDLPPHKNAITSHRNSAR